MVLMCPLCGEAVEAKDDAVFACPHCGGALCREPHGKAFVLQPVQTSVSAEETRALTLADKAAALTDPVRKHALLQEAEQLCPDCIRVQEELLHLGRLHERNPRKLDYSVIKCYLLNVFEEPHQYDEAETARLLDELTADPRLVRLLALSPLPEEARKRYVLRLCREYIDLFWKGSSQHMKSFMGFHVIRAERALADCGAQTLWNMEHTPLPAPYDTLLPQCFLEAFRTEAGSDVWLLEAKKELDT